MKSPTLWDINFEFTCKTEDDAKRACKRLASAGYRPELYSGRTVVVNDRGKDILWYVKLMEACNGFMFSEHILIVKKHYEPHQITIDELFGQLDDDNK